MTTARSEIVDLDATPYYHCMTRCVRRAHLCGDDALTGRNFDHRKSWIVERIAFLAAFFAIDVCAYAVMSNHLHLVLRVVAERVAGWTGEEVLRRAGQVCPTCVEGMDAWSEAKRALVIHTWRERLSSLSWFMSRLDEPIARRANAEDGCTGRFWEGRFKSQALMDDGALLTAMAYVDLNPVRAGLAEGLDESPFTSIQQRLRTVAVAMAREREASQEGPDCAGAKQRDLSNVSAGLSKEPRLEQCPKLAPLDGEPCDGREPLPTSFLGYLALLEWSGRLERADKPGSITGSPTRVLAEVGLDPTTWLESVEEFGALGGYVGHPTLLKRRASELGRRWLKGQSRAAAAYATAA